MLRHEPGDGLSRPARFGRRVRIALTAAALAVWGCSDPPASLPEPERLKIALRDYPLTFDPHLRSELITISVLGNVYESLVGFDAEGRIRPELATSWSNPDDLTWRFELDPDVEFHDGRPLTSRDVVASLERARHHPESNFSSFLVHVDEILAVDDLALEVTTTGPHALLLNKLAFVAVVPADSPAEGEIRDPVGSGPYEVTARQDREWVHLERFARHRRPASVPVVEFHSVSDVEERLEGLLEGHFQLIQELPPEAVEDLQRRPDLGARIRSTLRTEYLTLHPAVEPFDDPRVRQAIDLAIDREAYVENEAGGFGEPLVQLAARRVFGHDPDLGPRAAQRDRARELLAEAGHPTGLQLVLEAREGRSVEEVVRQLAEIGVDVEVRFRPWKEMFARVLEREVPFYYDGIIAVTVDASDILDHVAHSRDEATGYGMHNRVGYSNAEVDRLIERSGEVLEPTIRRRLMSEALRLVAEDRVFISLFSPHQIWGASERLVWTPRLDGMVELSDMALRESVSSP